MSTNDDVNILLVDDRPEGIYTLERVLEDQNYNLIKASSGQEALKHILNYNFALILLDVQMPIMDGFETASLIRERKKSSHVPIIFVTAISKDEQYVGKGYQSGAVDYLFKPINPEVLRSKVSVFVDLYLKNKQVLAQEKLLRDKKLEDQRLKFTQDKYDDLLRYESLANSIPHLLWRMNLEGIPEYFNEKWYSYTGIDFENSKKDFFSVIHEQDIAVVKRKWNAAICDPSIDSFSFECRIKNSKSNEYNWFWNLVVAEKNKDSKALLFETLHKRC